MARAWVGLTMVVCLPCMEMLRSREAHNSYVNCQKSEECYEYAIMSRKNLWQPRLPPTLRHKGDFAYQCTSDPCPLRAFTRTPCSRAPDVPVLSSDSAAEFVRRMVTPPCMRTHWPTEPDANRSLCKLGNHPGRLQTQSAGKAPGKLSVMPKEPHSIGHGSRVCSYPPLLR